MVQKSLVVITNKSYSQVPPMLTKLRSFSRFLPLSTFPILTVLLVKAKLFLQFIPVNTDYSCALKSACQRHHF